MSNIDTDKSANIAKIREAYELCIHDAYSIRKASVKVGIPRPTLSTIMKYTDAKMYASHEEIEAMNTEYTSFKQKAKGKVHELRNDIEELKRSRLKFSILCFFCGLISGGLLCLLT